MESKKTQLNIRLDPEIHRKAKALTTRKGLTLNEYATRVLTAAIEAEELADRPEFLDALERFLQQYRAKPERF